MFLPSWHVLRFPACRTSFCWLLLNREAENSEAASVTRAPCGSPDMKSNEDSRRCWRRRRPVQSLSITHDASDCLRFIWRWIVSLLKQLRWNLVCSFSHSVRSDPEWYCVNIHRFWLKYVAKIKWGAAFTIIYSAYRRINGIDLILRPSFFPLLTENIFHFSSFVCRSSGLVKICSLGYLFQCTDFSVLIITRQNTKNFFFASFCYNRSHHQHILPWWHKIKTLQADIFIVFPSSSREYFTEPLIFCICRDTYMLCGS